MEPEFHITHDEKELIIEDLGPLFDRLMSPYEAEQARIYQKALGMIKPVKELDGTFEGWSFRYVYYSDGSVEVVDFSSSNRENTRATK